MGDASVNGDMPYSATLDHIQKYPLVADGISTFKSYPIGQKSIDITNSAYSSLVKPAFPYLETPASYAKPYVSKADELGDSILKKVDEKVPVVKSETKDIQSYIYSWVHWPIDVVDEGKKYTFTTFDKQYKACGEDGVVAFSKALVTSGLIVSSDAAHYLASLLQKKQAELADVAAKTGSDAKETVKEKTDK